MLESESLRIYQEIFRSYSQNSQFCHFGLIKLSRVNIFAAVTEEYLKALK